MAEKWSQEVTERSDALDLEEGVFTHDEISPGEFLASPDKNAILAVNSKRVDFALMDEPVLK